MQEYHSLLRVVAETIYTTASALARRPLAVRTYVLYVYMLYVFVNHVVNVLNGKEKKRKGKEKKRNGNGTETERKGTVKKRTLFHDRYCTWNTLYVESMFTK